MVQLILAHAQRVHGPQCFFAQLADIRAGRHSDQIFRTDAELPAVGFEPDEPPAILGVEDRELAMAPVVLWCALESSDPDRAAHNQIF